ncbi:DUF4362 domain-containing protein [Paenibacillus flagellatus]|nr:DUF4362 domain-containing protein [Paenibacillus flagellatus]
MKKFILGFVLGASLFSLARIEASGWLEEVVLYPVKLLVNGKLATSASDTDYPVLNYKGSAYVPIRLVAETMNAKVIFWDEEEKVISINDPRAELPRSYKPDLARQNGDVVSITEGEAYNESRLAEFALNVEHHVDDWVRIVRYTMEGDPIIRMAVYADGVIAYSADSTRDRFGGAENRKAECASLVRTAGEADGKRYTDYTLTGCGPDRESINLYRWFAK